MAKNLSWVDFAALMVVTLLVYSGTFHHEFINYDDPQMITQNPVVQAFDIRDFFTRSLASEYSPLCFTVLGIEFKLFGLNAGAYHVVNTLLHALNSCLMMFLAWRLSRRRFIALFTGFIFALHPLHVESVAWVSEIKDGLSTFCYVLAILFYLNYLRSLKTTPKTAPLFWCFIAYVGSLLSKAMAITLPPLLLAFDWFEGRKMNRRAWIEKIPFLLLSIGAGLFRVHLDRFNTLVEPKPWSATEGISNGVQSLIFYLGKTLLPVKLAAIYEIGYSHLEIFDYAAALLFVVMITVAITRVEKIRRPVIFGALFFLVTASVILKVVPFGNNFKYADRYAYLPSFGLLLAAGFALENLRARYHRTVVIFCVILCGTFAWATVERGKVWATSESLWFDTLSKYPGSIATNNLGTYYTDDKPDLEMAEKVMKQALKLDPQFSRAHYHLANVYLKQHRWNEAITEYKVAVEMSPNYIQALHNMAYAYYQIGDFEKSELYYKKVLSLNNLVGLTYLGLGDTLYAEKKFSDSARAFQVAITLLPGTAQGHRGYANALLETGDLKTALDSINKALQLEPRTAANYQVLGEILFRSGQIKESTAAFHQALLLNPAEIKAREGEIRSLITAGDREAAQRSMRQAEIMDLKLNPDLMRMLKAKRPNRPKRPKP